MLYIKNKKYIIQPELVPRLLSLARVSRDGQLGSCIQTWDESAAVRFTGFVGK